jgi:Domain of unknown function (DUF1905)/Bacteriocin-protection, YdeI or OmpD-Associated
MSENETPLTDKDYLLQKYPGKGGWTFAAIPEIDQDKHAWFGWVKVRGTIDGYEINNYHLMPMGNGTLFLPVKAEIRKKIGKNEGDWVHITLYSQELPKINTEDFYLCLHDDPVAQANFNKLTEKEQTELIEWMYAPKNEQLKVERMAKALDKLSR